MDTTTTKKLHHKFRIYVGSSKLLPGTRSYLNKAIKIQTNIHLNNNDSPT